MEDRNSEDGRISANGVKQCLNLLSKQNFESDCHITHLVTTLLNSVMTLKHKVSPITADLHFALVDVSNSSIDT